MDVYKTWTPGPWTTPLDPVHGPPPWLEYSGLKYLILMPVIYMAEGILKVHVYCSKYHHWSAWYIILEYTR